MFEGPSCPWQLEVPSSVLLPAVLSSAPSSCPSCILGTLLPFLTAPWLSLTSVFAHSCGLPAFNNFPGCVLAPSISLEMNLVKVTACLLSLHLHRWQLIFFKSFVVYHRTDTWRWHVGTSCEALMRPLDPAHPVANPRGCEGAVRSQ